MMEQKVFIAMTDPTMLYSRCTEKIQLLTRFKAKPLRTNIPDHEFALFVCGK